MSDKPIARGIWLYPEEVEAIEEFQKKTGCSASEAVRRAVAKVFGSPELATKKHSPKPEESVSTADEKTKVRRVTHQQFFTLCSCLKRYEAEFKTTRPKYAEAARIMSQELGFDIPESSMRQAREATGVDWEPVVRSKPGTRSEANQKNIAIVAKAVRELCEAIGYPVPANLLGLLKDAEPSSDTNGTH